MSSAPSPWRPPASGVIRGCWQLSRGHGGGWSRELAHAALDSAASGPGPLFLDCADIYTGVEELLGDWMASRGEAAGQVVVHTKFVPDLAALPHIDRCQVRRMVLRSLSRLGVEVLDLVQLHWWDLAVPGWVPAAEWLAEFREEGIVRQIGVTNFDEHSLHTLLDAGIPIVTNQVQLSLLDRRPLAGLADLCADRGVTLLCYGTLAGGLLSDRAQVDSRSLTKYRLIVDEVGGPAVLERARAVLAGIAAREDASVADAAVAYVLSHRTVGAAIVGLSRRGLGADPRAVSLDPADLARLEAAVPRTVAGAVYEAERDRAGPHGRIMRCDLNRKGGARRDTGEGTRAPPDR